MTTVTSRVGLGNLDGPDRDRITLGRPDYADLFRLCTPTASAVPAERWARVMLEEIAGRGGQVIWRFLLGMRLARRESPDTLAGWRITARTEDLIRVEASSWFLTGQMVVAVADGTLSLTTALSYERRVGRWIWTPLSAVHRRLAPGLLRDTVARVGAPSAPG